MSVPAAVSAFPGENYQAPRSWTERAYHNLIYYNQPAQGGHFAAWEQPQIFSAEVRAGLRAAPRLTATGSRGGSHPRGSRGLVTGRRVVQTHTCGS